MKLSLLSFALLISSGIYAQNSREIYDDAVNDWNEGDYIESLESFKTILNKSDSEEYFERIALQTGELYQVMEITGDGLDPKFSKDGKHVIFSRKKDGVTISRIIEVATNKELFSVEGKSLEPAGDQRIFKNNDKNEMVRKAGQART